MSCFRCLFTRLVSGDPCTSQDFDEVLRVNLKGVFLVGALVLS